MSDLQTNHSFQLDLHNESIDPIHKTNLNGLLPSQTDPVLEFSLTDFRGDCEWIQFHILVWFSHYYMAFKDVECNI